MLGSPWGPSVQGLGTSSVNKQEAQKGIARPGREHTTHPP